MELDLNRILIVEDEDDHAILLEQLCRASWPHSSPQVTRAETHSDGIMQAIRGRADVVFWDLFLPDAILQDVVSDLKHIRVGAPIIVTTSHADPSLTSTLVGPTVQDFLSKQDLSTERLRRSVIQATERHRQVREQTQRVAQLDLCTLALKEDADGPLSRARALLTELKNQLPEPPPSLARLENEFDIHRTQLAELIHCLESALKSSN